MFEYGFAFPTQLITGQCSLIRAQEPTFDVKNDDDVRWIHYIYIHYRAALEFLMTRNQLASPM